MFIAHVRGIHFSRKSHHRSLKLDLQTFRIGFGSCLSTIHWMFIALLGVALGCSDNGQLPTYQMTGSVKYADGESISEGNVIFVAEGKPTGRSVIEDGKYHIGTYGDGDGAVEGNFRIAVTVYPPADFDPDARRRPPKLADEKYSAPDTSGLEFQVTKGGENQFDIVLDREK